MKSLKFDSIEKEAANFDLSKLEAIHASAKVSIAGATSVDDIKTAICKVWSIAGKYVKLAENLPIIGKFITPIADLLDTICGNS